MRQQGRRATTAEHIRQQYWKDQDIDMVERQQKIGRDRFLSYDVRLRSEEERQGQVYARRSKLYHQLGSGLTLICLNQKSKNEQLIWAACSHPPPLQLNLQFLQNRPLLPKQQYLLSRLTFDRVMHSFRQNARVELLAASRPDGCEARISYCYELDVWVICSKNVSLFALTPDDLGEYAAQWRDEPVGGVARLWLGKTAGMNREQLIEAKRTLDGFTALAWYCNGSSLVKNKHNQLLFYGMVRNERREEFCMDPIEARSRLEKLGLEFTTLKSIAKFQDERDMREALEELYMRVGGSPLEDSDYGREGSTVYFVEHRDHKRSSEVQVVGAGILLTIQYRIFRLIRQQLIDFTGGGAREQYIAQFDRRCSELQAEYLCYPPYPLDYYRLLLAKGLDFVTTGKPTPHELAVGTPELLDCLHYTIYKNIVLTRQLRDDRRFCQKIRDIKWSEYDGINCKGFTVYVPIELQEIGRSRLYQRLSNELARLGYRSSRITSTTYRQSQQERQDRLANEQLVRCLEQGFTSAYPMKQYFLYLDGINGPADISRLLKTLAQFVDRRYCYKVIFITPKTIEPLRIRDDSYWFGVESIASCLAISSRSSRDRTSRLFEIGKQLQIFSTPFSNSRKFLVEGLWAFLHLLIRISVLDGQGNSRSRTPSEAVGGTGKGTAGPQPEQCRSAASGAAGVISRAIGSGMDQRAGPRERGF